MWKCWKTETQRWWPKPSALEGRAPWAIFGFEVHQNPNHEILYAKEARSCWSSVCAGHDETIEMTASLHTRYKIDEIHMLYES